MSPAAWSLLTAAVSIAGLWISGQNPRAGWVYGIAAQAVWVASAVFTGRPGDILLSAAFVVIYGRNLLRWRGVVFDPTRKDPA